MRRSKNPFLGLVLQGERVMVFFAPGAMEMIVPHEVIPRPVISMRLVAAGSMVKTLLDVLRRVNLSSVLLALSFPE